MKNKIAKDTIPKCILCGHEADSSSLLPLCKQCAEEEAELPLVYAALKKASELIKIALGPMPGGGGPGAVPGNRKQIEKLLEELNRLQDADKITDEEYDIREEELKERLWVIEEQEEQAEEKAEEEKFYKLISNSVMQIVNEMWPQVKDFKIEGKWKLSKGNVLELISNLLSNNYFSNWYYEPGEVAWNMSTEWDIKEKEMRVIVKLFRKLILSSKYKKILELFNDDPDELQRQLWKMDEHGNRKALKTASELIKLAMNEAQVRNRIRAYLEKGYSDRILLEILAAQGGSRIRHKEMLEEEKMKNDPRREAPDKDVFASLKTARELLRAIINDEGQHLEGLLDPGIKAGIEDWLHEELINDPSVGIHNSIWNLEWEDCVKDLQVPFEQMEAAEMVFEKLVHDMQMKDQAMDAADAQWEKYMDAQDMKHEFDKTRMEPE